MDYTDEWRILKIIRFLCNPRLLNNLAQSLSGSVVEWLSR
jgi:hypothetical protein